MARRAPLASGDARSAARVGRQARRIARLCEDRENAERPGHLYGRAPAAPGAATGAADRPWHATREDGCADLRRANGPALLRQGGEVLLPACHRALPVARRQGNEDFPWVLGLAPPADAALRTRCPGRLPEAGQPRER